jgi:ubiquitin-conjugating enzyme E2 Q
MPRKLFYEHLQTLSNSPLVEVGNLKRGDDDGEIKFELILDDLAAPVHVTALVVPSLAEYPSEHSYFFSATDDDAPLEVAQALERASNQPGRLLKDVLENLVRSIQTELNNDEDDDFAMGEDQYEMDSDEDDMFCDSNPRRIFKDTSSFSSQPQQPLADHAQLRLCQDLAQVKRAGYKVSYSPAISSSQKSFLFISIRIAKLGLSEDAMQAWSILPEQYLVLAIHYHEGYRPLETLLSSQYGVSFKVGLCSTYRPDASQFLPPVNLEAIDSQHGPCIQPDALWHPTYISVPLEDLFNKDFIKILKYRQEFGLLWSGAERFLQDFQASADPQSLDLETYFEPETTKRTYTQMMLDDQICDRSDSDPLSFPLIAMQYLLRRFVRCAEFCLVCHSALLTELEAIRPYVCGKPLCLYQYMSLGFGPEIEHEIRSQPEIVDLLISMCWASAKSVKLKTYPDGLGLMVPPMTILLPMNTGNHVIAGGANAKPMITQVPETAKFVFDDKKCELYYDPGCQTTLQAGDWAVLRARGYAAEYQLVHVKVSSVSLPFVYLCRTRVSIESIHKENLEKGTEESRFGNSFQNDPTVPIFVYRYNTDLDSLEVKEKCSAIVHQLDILPSVLDMKTWLNNHPGKSLLHWKERISPVAIGILRWIIASNRSCILPVDDLERVGGMKGWKQFRFAMGAPDKEQRFIDALRNEALDNKEFPSFFAWHGSKVWNWHSIVREGLRFDYVASGRSFGNGVYHSLDCNVSLGYSGGHYQAPFSGTTENSGWNGVHWGQSSIKSQSIMALCEILNAPSKFVSKTPHLVVDKLDWIQVRYLFVKSITADEDQLPASSGPLIEQDPGMSPLGIAREKLAIPVTAIPVSRRPVIAKKKAGTPNEPGFFKRIKLSIGNEKSKNSNAGDVEEDDDADSVITEPDDLSVFTNVEAASKNSFLASLILRARQANELETTNWHSPSLVLKSSTNFVPGKLDYSKLPLLPPPTDASTSTTKQLMSQFKDLKKTQDTCSNVELGWYTDPGQLTNVFQWIVELHSFPEHLPLTKTMVQKDIPSVVLELRFPASYPFAPPFIRVIRPRFLPFLQGGGGHVTAGGSLCMELLTSEGWLATYDIASVLMQVRMAICSEDPRPAQLSSTFFDYSIGEACDGYIRACNAHGWRVPAGFLEEIKAMGAGATS